MSTACQAALDAEVEYNMSTARQAALDAEVESPPSTTNSVLVARCGALGDEVETLRTEIRAPDVEPNPSSIAWFCKR
jgi:hypothetical protein